MMIFFDKANNILIKINGVQKKIKTNNQYKIKLKQNINLKLF